MAQIAAFGIEARKVTQGKINQIPEEDMSGELENLIIRSAYIYVDQRRIHRVMENDCSRELRYELGCCANRRISLDSLRNSVITNERKNTHHWGG